MKLSWIEVEMYAPDTAVVRLGINAVLFKQDLSGNWKGTYHGCSGRYPAP